MYFIIIIIIIISSRNASDEMYNTQIQKYNENIVITYIITFLVAEIMLSCTHVEAYRSIWRLQPSNLMARQCGSDTNQYEYS